jgi:site-specific recombinase XerD
MTNPSKSYRNRSILSDKEIADMIERPDEIENEYYRLRVKALIALLKKFGKRRIEIARLR